MLVSRRVITSFPRWSLAGGARRERKLSVRQVQRCPQWDGRTLTLWAGVPRSTPAPALCCWGTDAPPGTPRERSAASPPAPPAPGGHKRSLGIEPATSLDPGGRRGAMSTWTLSVWAVGLTAKAVEVLGLKM